MTASTSIGQFESQTGQGQCAYDHAEQTYTLSGECFAWKRITGKFIVTAQVMGHGAGVCGWMARASLEEGAPFVGLFIHPNGDISLQSRATWHGDVEALRLSGAAEDVLQLERDDNAYTASIARFGKEFESVSVGDLELGGQMYVGLFSSAIGQSQFCNVRLVAPVADGFSREKDPFTSHMEILEVATGRRKILFSADHVFEAPNWTRDGAALIYNSGGRLYRYDLAAQTHAQIDTGDVIRNNNDHVLSFDGSLIAISSHTPPDGHSIVYTVPVGGGQPRRVTSHGPSYLHGWSADDKYLVYCALRNGDYDVYRISVDGGEEEQLTTAIGLDDGPEYTPDGAYIYFNSVRSGNMHIWRMKPDGSEQEQLTHDDLNNWFAHISPDGRWVIFVSYLVGEVEPSQHPPAKRVYLRVMPLDGGEPRLVAYVYGGQGTMNVPSWSPDGKFVAFVSNTLPI